MSIIFSFKVCLQEEDNRKGSEKDKEALMKIFEEFGFEVEPHDDLAANEITDQIKQFATKDYNKFGCVVVCMLSHGDEGTIYGTDGLSVSIEETKKEFYGNISLKDKPKVWIIQACQGNQLQEDFKVKQISEKCDGKNKRIRIFVYSYPLIKITFFYQPNNQ